MQERHVLAEARWRNMAQPGQLPVVGYLAGSNQLVQLMGQCQNSCNPMRTPLWLANGLGSEGGRRNTDTPAAISAERILEPSPFLVPLIHSQTRTTYCSA